MDNELDTIRVRVVMESPNEHAVVYFIEFRYGCQVSDRFGVVRWGQRFLLLICRLNPVFSSESCASIEVLDLILSCKGFTS